MNIFKETSLPTELKANSIYLIAPTDSTEYVEVYITGKESDVLRRTIKKADVLQLIEEHGGGGGSYDFSVEELDLYETANRVPSVMSITPDAVADNVITGTSIKGTITTSNQGFGGYFKTSAGSKFNLTVDCTQQSSRLFVNRKDEPTNIVYMDNESTDQIFGAAYVSNMLMVIAGTFLINTQVVVPPDKIGTSEIITFEFFDNEINIYHRGEFLGKYENKQKYDYYWQIANNQLLPDTYSSTFDLSQSVESIEYVLPANAKDGNIYHITSDGVLFNKKLLVDDYITVYDNKKNITVLRVPPEQTKQVTKVDVPFKVFYQNDNIFKRVKCYYDTELNSVCFIGSFYLNVEIDTSQQNTLFEIDLSNVPNSFTLNPIPVLCSYMKNGVYTIIQLLSFYNQLTGILELKVNGFDYMGTYEPVTIISTIAMS